MAIDIFFPEGESTHGNIKDMEYELKDFKQSQISLSKTVNEMYELTHVKLLRLYLCTKDKMNPQDEDLPKILKPKERKQGEITNPPTSSTIINPATSSTSMHTAIKNPATTSKREESPRTEDPVQDLGNYLQSIQGQCIPTSSEIIISQHGEFNTQVIPDLLSIDSTTYPQSSALSIPDDHDDGNSLEDLSDLIIFGPTDHQTSDMLSETIQWGKNATDREKSPSPPPLFDPVDLANRSPSPPIPDLGSLCLRIRRANIVNELISHFKNPNILKLQFKYEVIDERGADESGVSRDVYTSFWNNFFLKSAEGEEKRVPCLDDKWQLEEWKAVGKILYKGYIEYGYFPLQLAQAFVITLIFGEQAVTPELLFSSFMMYLSKTDRDTVSASIEGTSDNNDDLIDVLEQFGHSSIPSKEQTKHTFHLIAHKELIQKPKYAISCMAQAVREPFKTIFANVAAVMDMYESIRPTTKKVIKLLRVNPENNAERQCIKYFQQFIKSLEDPVKLRRCLQFLTGSDVISVDHIDVSFKKKGVMRCPSIHICGPLLELPSTYISYPDLRGEFESILSGNCMETHMA